MSCNFSTTPTVGAAGSIFASAVNLFTASQCLITEDWPDSATVASTDGFDFIIVGSGTAGSVLASRLSENSAWNVLLLEAGDDPPVESIIPGMDSTLRQTKYDWSYSTVKNASTNAAYLNETVQWSRGKMLGGSTGMDYMIYSRGSSADYNSWCNMGGNGVWCFRVVEPYFRKFESLQDQNLMQNGDIAYIYGTDGPVQIGTFNSTYRTLTEQVLSAWNENNVSTVDDLNYANMMGAAIVRANAISGTRFSAPKAYLNSIQNRTNLKIVKNALVSKVLINDSLTAYGVQAIINDVTTTFTASKEVILSAGAVNSPQLLMLSGLGPTKHLRSKNIKTLVDLPAVGQNLQDHTIVPVTIYCNDPAEEVVPNEEDSSLYLSNRTGFYAQMGFADISAHFTTDSNYEYPLHQSLLMVYPKNSSVAKATFGSRYKSYLADSVVQQNLNQSLYYFAHILLHPCSTGNISLRSYNIKDKPLIYANYFGCENDLNRTVAGLKKIANLVNTTYFKSIGGNLGRMNWTDCDGYELNSDDYWRCIAKSTVISMFEPVGTTRMGTSQYTAVVDGALRVHGVNHLRVVDAGIMPSHMSGNINAAVYLLAEKASDIIKMDYGVATDNYELRY